MALRSPWRPSTAYEGYLWSLADQLQESWLAGKLTESADQLWLPLIYNLNGL